MGRRALLFFWRGDPVFKTGVAAIIATIRFNTKKGSVRGKPGQGNPAAPLLLHQAKKFIHGSFRCYEPCHIRFFQMVGYLNHVYWLVVVHLLPQLSQVAGVGLQLAALSKRQRPGVTGDNEVIKHPNVNHGKRRFDRVRQNAVGAGWLDDSTRVIVGNDAGGRVVL